MTWIEPVRAPWVRGCQQREAIMQNRSGDIFSSAEIEYLKNEADSFGWYVWTEESKPIIEALCTRRLMAANGDFKVQAFRSSGPAAPLAASVGESGRSATMARYFELIGAGKVAFSNLDA
jgi:hypothetical protein